ncbi:MAG: choice-of-anchor J domain-containing protein, partial [Candidatus Cloacimonetes bacterium]|nr:choice-of-anchor J domain-containing protein [Candidatus Cloacimonadota bacterium]
MKRNIFVFLSVLFVLSFAAAGAILQEADSYTPVKNIPEKAFHQELDQPATVSAEKLHLAGRASRSLREGVDVVWADDFELETLYYYYVGADYFWEAPTEYPEFAVRYTPFHSGNLEGAWFYFYAGDASEVTLHFYDDDLGLPGSELATAVITPTIGEWSYYDLSGVGLAITRMTDVYMSFEVTGGSTIQIISDDGSSGSTRSYVHDGSAWSTIFDIEGAGYEWNMDLVVANTDVWDNPSDAWSYIDTYSHSESHSWWVPEDPGLYLASIESPVFTLVDGYNQYFISEWVDVEFFRSNAGAGSIDETFRLWLRNADAPTPDYWQISDFNAYSGNSWWCGVEDAGWQGGWGYGNNWDQFIETPEIDLTSAGNISLDFMTRWDSEDAWDYGYVRISTNNFQTYDVLASYTGTNNTWTAQSLDLSAYANETVKIRFQFISDSNTSDEDNLDTEGAWFIDDVVISDDTRTVFFEDDADTNVNFLINPGNVAWDLMYYDYDRDYPNPSTGWELIDKDHIFNGTADVTDYAGSNVQIRFTVSTDDSTYAQGAGCYVDDFEIIGSNMPPFDGANMFNVIPYPTTEGVDINPGIVYGNLGQNPINPTLRMDIPGQGGPFDYTGSNPGEIGSGEFGLGWLNPLPTTQLVEGTIDFVGSVIVGSDENPGNDTYTVEDIEVLPPGHYELGYNSRIWDGTYYTSSWSGTYFTPFSDGLLSQFTIESVKALFMNYGTDNHVEVEIIEIYEAIDDVTPGELIYSEDFDYTGAPPGEYHWAEFVLSEPQTLTEDFFVMVGGEHTTNPDASYNILFDAMVRQYLGAGAYTMHTVYYDATNEVWAHSSGDRFINAVGTGFFGDDPLPPANVEVDAETGLISWDPPGSGSGELYELVQHANDPQNAFYQQYNYGYGVVYDLSGFTNVTVEMCDFRHSSWGVFGTWDYAIHVVDWDTHTELAVIDGLQSTGDDQWELEIDLGSIAEDGLVGIFLEPQGNTAADAYPCLDGDNTLNGTSYYGALSNYSAMTLSTVGDFLMDLWIMADGTRMAQAPRIQVNDIPAQPSREPGEIITAEFVTPNQTINMRDLEYYQIYLNDSAIDTTTDTEYLLTGLTNGTTYVAGVSAVYTENESEVIEVEFVYSGQGSDNPVVPAKTILGNNYPNPFNPTTNIEFALKQAG